MFCSIGFSIGDPCRFVYSIRCMGTVWPMVLILQVAYRLYQYSDFMLFGLH